MTDTQQRFLAFIDIMGFKDLVFRNTHDEVLNKLKTISGWIKHIKNQSKEEVIKSVYAGEELTPYIFSDSILIFTKSNSLASIRLLLFACDYLFDNAIANHIPLKGCISYGTFSTDEDDSIFFGQPLIDAYLLQDELNYYGLILHHTAEKQIKSLKNGLSELEKLIISAKTPTKMGSMTYYNLKYTLGPENRKKSKSESDCLETLYSSVSGSARKYVDNTIEMFEKFKPKDR